MRFALADFVQARTGGGFPWGTLAVNAVGCFAFGLVLSVLGAHTHLPPSVKLGVLVGFMGAFTTFSTFAFDTHELLQDSWTLAAGNVVAHNLLGLVCLLGGLALGKQL